MSTEEKIEALTKRIDNLINEYIFTRKAEILQLIEELTEEKILLENTLY